MIHWDEYPLAIKEEILAQVQSHDELLDSLIDSPVDLGELQIDSVPGYCIIEQIQPSHSLHSIFLAISDPRITPIPLRHSVCIKLACVNSEHGRFSFSELEDCRLSIDKETESLRILSKIPQLHGKIPKLIHAGTIRIGSFETKYLVTEYFFSVRKARAEDLTSVASICQLLKILQIIHQQGIVHGDLTLENLMMVDSRVGQKALTQEEYDWKILDFGSVAFSRRWGLFSPSKRPSFAHRLAGPLDEIRYACPISASYDVACLALLIQESTCLAFTDAGDLKSGDFESYWRLATDPRPELRPSDAGQFRGDLVGLMRNGTCRRKWHSLSIIRAGLRRNTKTVALVVAMFSTVAFAATYAIYQRQLSSQARELNAQLSQTVESLMHRNSSMLGQITDLAIMERIGVGQGKSQIDGLVEQSLATWGNSNLNPQVRITALRLLVDASQAMLEFHKSKSSHACLIRTYEAIQRVAGQSINKNPLVRLLTIRIRSKLIRLAVQYNHPMPLGQDPQRVAKELVDDFLSMDLLNKESGRSLTSKESQIELLHRETLCCAENLLRSAIYVFRGSDWLLAKTPVVQRVYEHATKSVNRQDKTLCVPLAALECQYAFMIHKGFLSPVWWAGVDDYSLLARIVQQRYIEAQALVQEGLQDKLTDEDANVARELRLRIPNYLGMSYSQQGDFSRARGMLQEAWRLSKQELDQAPKSVLCLRRAANAVWDLADTYTNEIFITPEMNESCRMELNKASIPHRNLAIELCRQWVRLDRSKESEVAYVVNVLRGFYSEFSIGNEGRGLQILHQAQQEVILKDPGIGHSNGDELLIASAFLHVREPGGDGHRNLYESSLERYREWLIEHEPADGQNLQQTHRDRIAGLTRLMQSEIFGELEADSRWRGLKQYAQRILNRSSI